MILKAEWFTDRVWKQTILGHPLSKANSRRSVLGSRKYDTAKGKAGTSYLRPVKSVEALDYQKAFVLQCWKPREPFRFPLILYAKVYWRSWRSDVDISLIKDSLQAAAVIANDRLIRFEIVDGTEVDGKRPRAEIELFRWLPGIPGWLF